MQWNLSNQDTNGAEESVIVSEVSSFQRLQEWYCNTWVGKGVLFREVSSVLEGSTIHIIVIHCFVLSIVRSPKKRSDITDPSLATPSPLPGPLHGPPRSLAWGTEYSTKYQSPLHFQYVRGAWVESPHPSPAHRVGLCIQYTVHTVYNTEHVHSFTYTPCIPHTVCM